MDSFDVVKLQNITYVMCQNTSNIALSSIWAVENSQRERRGEAPAWSYESMMLLIDKYQLSHNAVITNLHL